MVRRLAGCCSRYTWAMALLCLLLYSELLQAQVSISGQITAKTGEALSRINVMVYLPDNLTMLAFAVSDEKGYFACKVNSAADSLIVKISSISYRNENRPIANVTQKLQFRLTEDAKQLQGVSVYAAPIVKRGDTVSYLVNAFVHTQDRAIEDVLRRMPGIEVESGGRILYQGVPINKFYVEGLDLMEGRYGLITRNLPPGSVSAVEILENHQPLRMLQDKVESQQAALNLKIKKGVVSTGTAQLGAGTGLNPLLWDVNITPMTFSKKYQLLSSVQTNNTGNDVSQQLHVFTPEDLKRTTVRPSERIEMLNIVTAIQPVIKPDRYLNNHIFQLNFNGLQHINSDFILRSNLCYSYDDQPSQAVVLRSLYMPADTLHFSEKYDNQVKTNRLYGVFNINRNVKKNYLNDDLKLNCEWNKQTGLINADGNTIKETLKNPFTGISNELKSYNPIGKQIWEFQSFTLFDHSPHSLAVSPGQFDEVLNNSEPYPLVIQNLDIKRFYTDNSAGFVLGIKSLTASPRAGVCYQQQTLLSGIHLPAADSEKGVPSALENTMDIRSTQAYILTDIEYKAKRLILSAAGSLKQHSIEINDETLHIRQHPGHLLAGGQFSADYKFNSFWRLDGSLGYSEHLSDVDDLHSGYIMQDYRSLSQNMIPVSIVSTQKVSSSLEYRNQIESFFNSFSYIYTVSHSSGITNSLISDNGSSIDIREALPGTTHTLFLQIYSSKFFLAARTTTSLRVNYMQIQGKSWVNGESFDTRNRMVTIKPSVSVRFTQWMNLEYNLEANRIYTFIDAQQKSNIPLTKHYINFFIFPVKNQLVNFTSEYYKHNGSNNLFVDVSYRYTFTNQRLDLEMKCNNIFNAQTYTSYFTNAYSVWETTYMLRPFQLMFSVKLNF